MSETVKITGTVRLVEETKTYGQKGFQKRLMVIQTEDKYQNTIPVEATRDKCAMFDDFKPGEEVTAFVNIRGSEYNNRFFCNLECWKIQLEGSGASNSPAESESGGDSSYATDEDLDSSIPF